MTGTLVRRLPMFPLESVLLPGALLSLHIFEDRYRVMIGECLAGDRSFGVVLIERGREVGGNDVRVGVGTVAVIEQAAELPGDRYALVCRGTSRLKVLEWLPDDPYPVAQVELQEEGEPVEPARIARAEESVRRAWALLSELGAESPLDPVVVASPPGTEPKAEGADEAWSWCGLAPLTALDRLRLLQVERPAERLDLLCELTDAVAGDARALLGGGTVG